MRAGFKESKHNNNNTLHRKKVDYAIQRAILVEVLNYVLYCLISSSVLKQTIIVHHYTEFTIISSS